MKEELKKCPCGSKHEPFVSSLNAIITAQCLDCKTEITSWSWDIIKTMWNSGRLKKDEK